MDREEFKEKARIYIAIFGISLVVLFLYFYLFFRIFKYDFLDVVKRVFSGAHVSVGETAVGIVSLVLILLLLIWIRAAYNALYTIRFEQGYIQTILSRSPGKRGYGKISDTRVLYNVLGDDGLIIGAEIPRSEMLKKILVLLPGFGWLQKFSPFQKRAKIRLVRLKKNETYRNALVVGPVGSGKSSGFLVPNLLKLPDGVSAVVIDPKRELEALTRKSLEERGYEIMIFNPDDPEHSWGYDPVFAIYNEEEAVDIAEIILQNGYGKGGETRGQEWISMSAPLMTATLLTAYHLSPQTLQKLVETSKKIAAKKQTGIPVPGKMIQVSDDEIRFLRQIAEQEAKMNSEMRKLSEEYKEEISLDQFMTPITDAIDLIIGSSGMDDNARLVFFRAVGKINKVIAKSWASYENSIQSPQTAASIRTVLSSTVQIFNRKSLITLTKIEKKIKFEALREKPTVLFIQISPDKGEIFKPLLATFFWQLFRSLMREGAHEPEKLRPVFFFLDEFANVGKIPGFAQMAATLRGYRVALVIIVQNVEQLSRNYTKEEAEDILGNMMTKIFLGGVSGTTADYLENLVGIGVSEKSAIPLVQKGEARLIPSERALVVYGNRPPVILHIPYYFKYDF